jgi:hypothetical protein
VATTGSLLWYDFAISAQPEGQSAPAVAFGGDDNSEEGQYLAVWQDEYGGNSAIFGQRLSATGEPLEEPWIIQADGRENVEPLVAYSTQKEQYLVMWANTTWDTIEERVVYPGGVDPSVILVPDSTGGRRPRLAYDEAEDLFLAVWEANSDIYARVLDGDGHALTTESTYLAGRGTQIDPAEAFDSANERFLVAWQDNVTGEDRITGTLVDAKGQMIGSYFVIAGRDGVVRYHPAVAYNSVAGEYLVTYE